MKKGFRIFRNLKSKVDGEVRIEFAAIDAGTVARRASRMLAESQRKARARASFAEARAMIRH
jgi:hypothetical protein